jgi:hypothetical protein
MKLSYRNKLECCHCKSPSPWHSLYLQARLELTRVEPVMGFDSNGWPPVLPSNIKQGFNDIGKHSSLLLFVKKYYPMFVEWKVHYSALFTYLVRWHAGAVSFPPSDAILAQLAWPLSDVMFYIHSGITNLSLYKHWYYPKKSYGTGPW